MLQTPCTNIINLKNIRRVICSTCLSSNRVLYSMQLLPQLLNICNGITLKVQNNICWECKTQLLKILKFRQKALKSQSVLARLSELELVPTERHVLVQSLSTLTRNELFNYELKLVEVKKEVPEFVITPKEEELDKTVPEKVDPAADEEFLKEGQANELLPIKSEPERASSPDSDNVCDVTEAPDRDQIDGIILKTMSEEEMVQFREKEKSKNLYKNSEYKCEKCIQAFSNELLMNKHNEKHYESNGPFICRVCEQRFVYDSALHTHLKVHYTYYECRDCRFTHPVLHNMFVHRQRNHDNRIRQCNQCDAQFSSTRRLSYHKRIEHSARPSCDLCHKKFTQISNLKRHMIVHTTGVPMVQCAICHKQYRGEWGLKAHMRTHTDTVRENAYCAECNIQFKNLYLYRNHLKFNKKHMAPGFFKFECSDCGKKYLQKTLLRQHIEAIHLKLKNYGCDICEVKLSSSKALSNHKRRQHSNNEKIRNYICHICAKAFYVRKTLNEHMNVHTGARPYKCDVCGDTFAYSSALFTHNRLVHLKHKRRKKATEPVPKQSCSSV